MYRCARILVPLLLLSLLVPAVADAATPAPRRLPAAIEPLARYAEQTTCDPVTRPGTAALARLLVSTYRGTGYNTTYACGTDGTRSEHYDGRAIDWMVSVRSPSQFAAGKAFIAWLLATDSAGNQFAMARRLGVQYVIYNNRMWGSWDGRWEDYNGCSRLPQPGNDNACHRTHMHISLGWNGAMGRTTYWTGHVYPTDFGPCRTPGLNWAERYWHANPTPCPNQADYHAAAGSSALKRTLVYYSGVVIHPGLTGPAVTAVQQALHVPATGRYDQATYLGIRAFKARHAGLSSSGRLRWKAWLVLLATVR